MGSIYLGWMIWDNYSLFEAILVRKSVIFLRLS